MHERAVSMKHEARARRSVRGRPARSGQKGVMMVEALVAILIFSLGILGVVGMQARSVQMMTEAVFRAQAAQHASALIADMWMTNPAQRANLYASAGSNPLRYNQWKAVIESGAKAMPGATANPPVVAVDTQQVAYSTAGAGNQTVSQVTVTVFWQPPGVATPSSYTTTAMIMEPQS